MALITDPGHAQADDAVGAAPASGDLAVVVLHGDLVAEEFRRPGAGVRDQRLVLRQFQLEFVTQELRQALFDLLGFGLRSGEPEQGVVGVTRRSAAAGSRDRADPRWACRAAACAAPAPAVRSPRLRARRIACRTLA